MTPEQEKQVIQKILAGDRTAFAQIVDAHEKQVYNLALRTLQNPEDAQDITQEVFLKVYSDIGSFRGDSRLSVWLYRVTYNLCIDLLRKQKRRPTVSLTYETEDGEEEMDFPDTRYTPETELERRELQSAVQDALAQLSEEHRRILLMREFEDFSYTEIARLLGIQEGTVKSRIARARERVAKYLVKSGTFSASIRHTHGKEGRE